jgi:hypothetical protein
MDSNLKKTKYECEIGRCFFCQQDVPLNEICQTIIDIENCKNINKKQNASTKRKKRNKS